MVLKAINLGLSVDLTPHSLSGSVPMFLLLFLSLLLDKTRLHATPACCRSVCVHTEHVCVSGVWRRCKQSSFKAGSLDWFRPQTAAAESGEHTVEQVP